MCIIHASFASREQQCLQEMAKLEGEVAEMGERAGELEALIAACADGGDVEDLQQATLDQAKLTAVLEAKEERWFALAGRAEG